MKNTLKLNINYDLNKIVELHNDLKKNYDWVKPIVEFNHVMCNSKSEKIDQKYIVSLYFSLL